MNSLLNVLIIKQKYIDKYFKNIFTALDKCWVVDTLSNKMFHLYVHLLRLQNKIIGLLILLVTIILNLKCLRNVYINFNKIHMFIFNIPQQFIIFLFHLKPFILYSNTILSLIITA